MAENTGNTQTRKLTCCTSYHKLSSSGMLEDTPRDTLVKELACYRFFPIPEALAPYYIITYFIVIKGRNRWGIEF